MEAIIARTSTGNIGVGAAEWLRTGKQIGRATLRLTQHLLVNYSRAGLLLRGGDRPARRI